VALIGKFIFEGPRSPDVSFLAARALQEQIVAVGNIDAVLALGGLGVRNLPRLEPADKRRDARG